MPERRTVLSITTICITTSLTGCLDTITSGERGFSGVESNVEDRQREIVTIYDDALTTRNNATEARNTGVNRFNAEEYSEAINRFESARTGYEDAEERFAEATELATELAEEEAASICEVARDEARLQIEATEAALAAATAGEEGADASTINDHVEEFQEVETQADALTVEDTEVLAEVLGVQ